MGRVASESDLADRVRGIRPARMDREAARKAIAGDFLFEVTGPNTKVLHYRVDMRQGGTITKGKGPAKPKPDVTIRVSDQDMVALATGKATPQSMFIKGQLAERISNVVHRDGDTLMTWWHALTLRHRTSRPAQAQRERYARPQDEQRTTERAQQAQ